MANPPNHIKVIATGAPALFGFRLLQMLVAKRVLTQDEAAKVMEETSEDIRAATEGDPGFTGETAARAYEQMAALLLGSPEKLND
jgi:hypothetical protein